jgi:hypothetical protein
MANIYFDSMEQKEPSSFKYPHGIHKYLHLEVKFTAFWIKNDNLTFNRTK